MSGPVRFRNFETTYWSDGKEKTTSVRIRELDAKPVARGALFDYRERADAFFLAEDDYLYCPVKRSHSPQPREAFISLDHLKLGLANKGPDSRHPFDAFRTFTPWTLFGFTHSSTEPEGQLRKLQEHLDQSCAIIGDYFVEKVAMPVCCVSVDLKTKPGKVYLSLMDRLDARDYFAKFQHPVAFFSLTDLGRAEELALGWAKLLGLDDFRPRGRLTVSDDCPASNVQGLAGIGFDAIRKGIGDHAFQVPPGLVRLVPELAGSVRQLRDSTRNLEIWRKVHQACPVPFEFDATTPKSFVRLALHLQALEASITGEVRLTGGRPMADALDVSAAVGDLLDVGRPSLLYRDTGYAKAWVDLLEAARAGGGFLSDEIEALDRSQSDLSGNDQLVWENAIRAASLEAIRSDVVRFEGSRDLATVDLTALFTDIEPLLETLRRETLASKSAPALHENIAEVLQRIDRAKSQMSTPASAKTDELGFEP